MPSIIQLREEHLEDTARLVSDRYQRLREQVPDLPQRYADIGNLVPVLQGILKPGIPAILQGG